MDIVVNVFKYLLFEFMISLSISSPCWQQTSPTHPFYRTSTSSSSPWNSRGPLPSTAPSPRRPSEEYRRHSPFCSLTEEDDPRSRYFPFHNSILKQYGIMKQARRDKNFKKLKD